MKKVVIDTEKYDGIICPYSKTKVLFYPDCNEIKTADEILEQTFIQGFVVTEVSYEVDPGKSPYRERWNAALDQALEAEEEDEDNYFDFDEFIENYEDEDLMLLEVTTYGMACGPLSFTDYYLVKESDWEKAELIESSED